MLDANGSRFELLLGEPDWGRCLLADGSGRTLAQEWGDRDAAEALVFERESQSLTLAQRVARFRAPPSDAPPDPARRLGAASDAFGNVYWIAEAGTRIEVLSAGARTPSLHSLAQLPPPARAEGDFAPAVAPRARAQFLRGLAVTREHYLVAGVLRGAGSNGGLRVFDLIAGGPGLPLRWPAAWPFEPWDLAPRPCGGLAVLDRTHARVWLLDRRLGMHAIFPVEADDPSRPDDFAPAGGSRGTVAPPARQPWWPLVVDAAGGGDPVAIDVLADGAVVVVDGAGSDGFPLVSVYVDGVLSGRASTAGVLDVIDADEREGFVLRAHAAALARVAQGLPDRLVIASQEGNQCFAFDLLRDGAQLALQPVRSFLPMRRFGGKGFVRRRPDDQPLLAEDTGLLYDGAGVWLPLVRERRPRYAREGALETPVFDSREPACVWHRVVMDGCIPSGSQVRIAARAGDVREQLRDLPYRAEPLPVLRPDGSELPWVQEGPGAQTDATLGRGSWELLLQRARGRYLQLRLVVESADELAAPRLFALRAWSPRFSYARRYLPAVYREDERSADFLERFLANFEGMFTTLEDRIVASSALFDVRSAPADTLDWLAGWLGLLLDPAVDAERKRLLIRFAVPLFQYRGTTQGLRLATELVLSPCVRPGDFALPARSQQQPYGVRIVERFLMRRLPRALLGETVLDVPRRVAPGERWSNAEGHAGLQRRWQAALAQSGASGAESLLFAPVPPAGHEEAWRAFSTAQLGAVPRLAATLGARWRQHLAALPEEDRAGVPSQLPWDWPQETRTQKAWRDFVTSGLPGELRRWLARWQAFLARRYQRPAAFERAWGARWPEFGLVPAPEVLPPTAEGLADWALFETRIEPMAQAAHRFLVLVPSSGPLAQPQALARHMEWARRVVGLEKPAHTVFEVGPYWAMFRTGHARLGLDTLLGEGSRAPSLAPQLVVDRGHVGASRVAFTPRVPRDRVLLAC
jgi:phage tail-like protein